MDEGGAINSKLIYPLATAVVFHLAWLLVKGVFDDLKNGSGDRRVGGLSLLLSFFYKSCGTFTFLVYLQELLYFHFSYLYLVMVTDLFETLGIF